MDLDKNTKVADWYQDRFPDDELGSEIDDEVTFADVIDCIENEPGTLYSLLGVGDSVVRERLFTAVGKLLHKPYGAIYDRWLDKKSPSIMESVALIEDKLFNEIVLMYVLEGHSIQEALRLAEDTITPETISRIEQLPSYKKLVKDIEFYTKANLDVPEYRDTEFKEDPLGALENEADFCEDVADFLGSIRLKGFGAAKTDELVDATIKDVDSLQNSAKRLKNMLKKQDKSMYLRPDGSVNVNTNQKPMDYARRALRKLRDFFERLGQEWANDPDFYEKHPEITADLDGILRKRGLDKVAVEGKDWKQYVRTTVDAAIDEGIYNRQVLLNMSDDLPLTEEQKEYFKHYVYFMFE